jgi:hypothetical protein
MVTNLSKRINQAKFFEDIADITYEQLNQAEAFSNYCAKVTRFIEIAVDSGVAFLARLKLTVIPPITNILKSINRTDDIRDIYLAIGLLNDRNLAKIFCKKLITIAKVSNFKQISELDLNRFPVNFSDYFDALDKEYKDKVLFSLFESTILATRSSHNLAEIGCHVLYRKKEYLANLFYDKCIEISPQDTDQNSLRYLKQIILFLTEQHYLTEEQSEDILYTILGQLNKLKNS